MSNRARWVMAAALAVTCSLGWLATAGAQESANALDLFKQGLTLYKTGEFSQAKDTFERVLAMDPSLDTALKMRELAEMGMLVEMQREEGMADVATRLLKLTTKAVRARKREVLNPDRLLADFQSLDADDYLQSATVLKSHGPFAVPYLMPLLAKEGADASTTLVVGRTVALIGDMHTDACMPLIEALSGAEADILRVRVAKVLGDLRDSRALPALVAMARDEDALQTARDAASVAVQKITGKAIETLAATDAVYLELVRDYYNNVGTRVGFTYGFQGAVWAWDADKQTVGHKLVPSYLYNDIMAVKLALEALQDAPDNEELKATMVSALARQKALATHYSQEAAAGGDADIDRDDAAKRAETLSAHIPVVTALLDASTVGRALEISVESKDVPGSLIILDVLRAKLHALVPAIPDEETVASLVAALSSPYPPVRYEAAIIFCETVPTAQVGPAEQVMAVMSKAVRSAAQRTALIVMNDLHARNTLATALRALKLNVIEARISVTGVTDALQVMPSVDVVFVAANPGVGGLADVMEFIRDDYRTTGLPLYGVIDQTGGPAELSGVPAITVLNLTVEKLEPLLTEVLTGPSRSVSTEDEAALVLKGATALTTVRAGNTQYPLAMAEPSLVSSLGAYDESVSAAVIKCLAEFGSEMALRPLADFTGSDASAELKASAADCIAAILERTGAEPTEPVVNALTKALMDGEQVEQEAAAAALSVAGLETARILELAGPRAGEVMPAAAVDISTIPAPSARTRLLKFAPPNVDAVVRVDLNDLAGSALVPLGRAIGGPAATAEKATEMVVFLRAPVGVKVDNPSCVGIVAFEGSTAAELADILADGTEKITVGGIDVYKAADGGSYAAVADDASTVFATDEGLLQLVVLNIRKDRGSLLVRDVSEAFGTYRNAAVNIAAKLPDEYMDRARGKLPTFTNGMTRLAMGVYVVDGAEVRAQALYETEAAAELAVAGVEGQVTYGRNVMTRMAEEGGDTAAAMGKLTGVLDKVQASAVADVLTVSAKMTAEEVQSAVEAIMATALAPAAEPAAE